MSVYLSCRVTATGPDELVDTFVNQVMADLPKTGIDVSESDTALFIGGRNYDATHDLLAIAQCFDGLPVTVEIEMLPEQEEAIYRMSVDCLTGTVTRTTEEIDRDELIPEDESVALGL